MFWERENDPTVEFWGLGLGVVRGWLVVVEGLFLAFTFWGTL